MPVVEPTQTGGRKDPAVVPVRALACILLEEFGVPFRFFDAGTGEPVGVSDAGVPLAVPAMAPGEAVRLARDARAEVVPVADDQHLLRLPIADREGCGLVAVGVLPALAREPAGAEVERTRLRKWGQAIRDRLSRAADAPARQRPAADPGLAASRAWESLLGLEHLLHGTVLHREPERNRRRILRTAAGLLGARTIA